MELLAPAGSIDHFLVALEAGADAVYLGAPRLNARNLARDLSFEEIAALISFAHERQRRVHVAVNSLVREQDLALTLETLAILAEIGADALIVQDLGLINLAHSFFPQLPLHGSTLMTTHNREGLRLLAHLGCSRAVLAREMTLDEIASMTAQKELEIEVFVHGAMCYSYSGLCLFSSYFGGKSGLRGNCVQPCRRKYDLGGSNKRSRSGGKSGYWFSMNDLQGLALIPKLKDIGVDCVKIEGRLRSTTYVSKIVQAYRMVIDAGVEQQAEALRSASALIPEAHGRKTSTGFFLGAQPKSAITPQHSGNIGAFLGKVDAVRQQGSAWYGTIIVRQTCAVGDRIRLHDEQSGERTGFNLERMLRGSQEVATASQGEKVAVLLPAGTVKQQGRHQFLLYRTDVKESGKRACRNDLLPLKPDVALRSRFAKACKQASAIHRRLSIDTAVPAMPQKIGRIEKKRKSATEIWIRTDSPELLFKRLPFQPSRWILNLNRQSMAFTGQLKASRKGRKWDIVWALPPITHVNASAQLRRDIMVLIRSRFRTFQIANLAQVELFGEEKVTVFGDYTLNLLNSQALLQTFAYGLAGAQLCIEADRDCLQQALAGLKRQSGETGFASMQKKLLGLTVFGTPPLFTSRLAANEQVEGRSLVSPKQERFVVEKQIGVTVTRAIRPFSLLPYQDELAEFGIDYLVLDLCGMNVGSKDLQELEKRLKGRTDVAPLPSFNYRGGLG